MNTTFTHNAATGADDIDKLFTADVNVQFQDRTVYVPDLCTTACGIAGILKDDNFTRYMENLNL